MSDEQAADGPRPRRDWHPKRDTGSGLQRLTDYRDVTDFKTIRTWVLARDGHQCHYCTAVAAEVDHLWPRRFGGSDHINNLVAACRKCNSSKGAAINLSAARPDLIEVGIDAIVARIKAEVEELERWTRAYSDSWARTGQVSSTSRLMSIAFKVGDPLIGLKLVKDSLHGAADAAMQASEVNA